MLAYVLISLIFQMLGFLLLSLKACLDIDSLNLKLVCRTYRVWLMQNISVEGNQSKWSQWYFVSSSQTTCCCVSDLNCDFIYISFMALICVNRFQFDWSATKYHTNRYHFTGIHTLVDFDWYKLALNVLILICNRIHNNPNQIRKKVYLRYQFVRPGNLFCFLTL